MFFILWNFIQVSRRTYFLSKNSRKYLGCYRLKIFLKLRFFFILYLTCTQKKYIHIMNSIRIPGSKKILVLKRTWFFTKNLKIFFMKFLIGIKQKISSLLPLILNPRCPKWPKFPNKMKFVYYSKFIKIIIIDFSFNFKKSKFTFLADFLSLI